MNETQAQVQTEHAQQPHDDIVELMAIPTDALKMCRRILGKLNIIPEGFDANDVAVCLSHLDHAAKSHMTIPGK